MRCFKKLTPDSWTPPQHTHTHTHTHTHWIKIDAHSGLDTLLLYLPWGVACENYTHVVDQSLYLSVLIPASCQLLIFAKSSKTTVWKQIQKSVSSPQFLSLSLSSFSSHYLKWSLQPSKGRILIFSPAFLVLRLLVCH